MGVGVWWGKRKGKGKGGRVGLCVVGKNGDPKEIIKIGGNNLLKYICKCNPNIN